LHAAYNEICSPLYYKNLEPIGYGDQDFLWKHFGLCNESANVVDASKVTQILRTLLLFHTRLNELEGKDAHASYGKNIFDYSNMPKSSE
jgi:hypothetical protein